VRRAQTSKMRKYNLQEEERMKKCQVRLKINQMVSTRLCVRGLSSWPHSMRAGFPTIRHDA
jgi:hypothetical protein